MEFTPPDTLETVYQYLPLPYRISIERLDSSGIRERRAAHAELRQWCDAYAVSNGLALDTEWHRYYVNSAIAIANRRFCLDDPAPFVDVAWIDDSDGRGPVKLSNSIRCF
jgi:hypothetical protein